MAHSTILHLSTWTIRLSAFYVNKHTETHQKCEYTRIRKHVHAFWDCDWLMDAERENFCSCYRLFSGFSHNTLIISIFWMWERSKMEYKLVKWSKISYLFLAYQRRNHSTCFIYYVCSYVKLPKSLPKSLLHKTLMIRDRKSHTGLFNAIFPKKTPFLSIYFEWTKKMARLIFHWRFIVSKVEKEFPLFTAFPSCMGSSSNF